MCVGSWLGCLLCVMIGLLIGFAYFVLGSSRCGCVIFWVDLLGVLGDYTALICVV